MILCRFKHIQVLLATLAVVIRLCDASQICSTCSDVARPGDCHRFTTCDNNEQCYQRQYTNGSGNLLYEMGCILSKACHNTPIMIGKRVDSRVKRFEDNHFSCLACCKHASMCNKNLSCDGTIMPTLPSTLPRDCSELKLTNRHNGSYTIYPYGVSNISTTVYCEFETDGTWTVIQRRYNGSVNFYRNWTQYQRGFGSSDGEYWLGNDIIHQLTSMGNYTLKILLTDWKNHSSYAEYSVFYVGDEYYNYTLKIGGYRGNAMDFMTYHNGMQFSTLDRDNDNYNGFDCVDWCGKGAWWHNHCCESSLNAVYANHDVRFPYGIAWNQFLVKTTRMMIKRK